MDDLSSRFLAGFNVIEDWMRHRLDAEDSEEFGSLLRRLEKLDGLVRRHSAELKRLARLRNLIAHSHRHEKPLAVPTEESVERIESLGRLLPAPPSLFSLAAKPVEQCQLSDPLGRCVNQMHKGDFSQLPIFDAEKFHGLLTTETITHWLAAFFTGDGQGIVDEQTVAEVMKHQEESPAYDFMARSATVADALTAFDKFLRRGRRLEAILITHTGRQTEALLGIVTIHDIPRLNNALNA